MNPIQIRHTVQGLGQAQPAKPKTAPEKNGQFQDLLQKSMTLQDGLKFSAHALDRLRTRNISLGSQDMLRLNDAVGRAEDKGSRDSLVLMDNVAYVVSVKNKTVVTAMTDSQMRDSVITNIDSTVMA